MVDSVNGGILYFWITNLEKSIFLHKILTKYPILSKFLHFWNNCSAELPPRRISIYQSIQQIFLFLEALSRRDLYKHL